MASASARGARLRLRSEQGLGLPQRLVSTERMAGLPKHKPCVVGPRSHLAASLTGHHLHRRGTSPPSPVHEAAFHPSTRRQATEQHNVLGCVCEENNEKKHLGFAYVPLAPCFPASRGWREQADVVPPRFPTPGRFVAPPPATQPQRLLLIVPWLRLGGSDRVNVNIASLLRPEFQTTVVATLGSEHPWFSHFARGTG